MFTTKQSISSLWKYFIQAAVLSVLEKIQDNISHIYYLVFVFYFLL